MFTTLVVALDLQAAGDRALPVVRALAELGDVDVELLTVCSPGLPADVDAFELSRRATANGWPAQAVTVLHAHDAAAAIVAHMAGRHDALLVMATSAKRPVVGRVLGSVTEEVLRTTTRPVLLVGGRVPAEPTLARPTLVACVDGRGPAASLVAPVAAWTRTFAGGTPWVAEVVPTAATGARPAAGESSTVRYVAGLLAAEGVDASWEVLHGGEPATWLDDFATNHVTDPVFVAVSRRWTDGRTHWHSDVRDLVARSAHPVLVVPAETRAAPGASLAGRVLADAGRPV